MLCWEPFKFNLNRKFLEKTNWNYIDIVKNAYLQILKKNSSLSAYLMWRHFMFCAIFKTDSGKEADLLILQG